MSEYLKGATQKMAARRMFAKRLIATDRFMEMPPRTQVLYFHLAMQADDDGFVTSAKRVMRLVGTNRQSLQQLVDRGFLICFDSGAAVIVDWRVHNQIRRDRYVPTSCREEAARLWLDEEERYTLKETGRRAASVIFGNRMATQDRSGQDSTGEEREGQVTENGVGGIDSFRFERVRAEPEKPGRPQTEEQVFAEYADWWGLDPEETLRRQPWLLSHARELTDSLCVSYGKRRATAVDLGHVLRCCYRCDKDRGLLYYNEDDGGLLQYAFEQSVNAGKPGEWYYVLGTLDRLRERGLVCREEAEIEEERWRRRKNA